MSRVLAEPSAGQPISATFFAELLREVRANRPLNGKNVSTVRTPNGTHISAVGESRAASIKKIPGRFEIKSITPDDPPESGGGGVSSAQNEEEEEERTYTVKFENPYYDIGGKTYEMPANEDVDPPAVEISGVKDGDIIVLKVKAGESRSEELATVSSLSALQQLQEDVAYYSIPLYKVKGGKVVCDLRTGPISGMGEF